MRITLEGDDRQTLIARLGLSSDASDADLQQAVTARILAESAPTPTPEPTPPNPTPPEAEPGSTDPDGGGAPNTAPEPDDDDDVEHVDAAAYRALVARAGQADRLEEEARIQARDQLVEDAIKAGKFPPSRRDHYRNRYDSDPEATKASIDRMAKNVVPVKERGKDVIDSELEASDTYPSEWLNGGTPQPSNGNGAGSGSERRQSRVITED